MLEGIVGDVLLALLLALIAIHIALWIRDVRIAARKQLPTTPLELWRYPLDESRKLRFTNTVLAALCAIALAIIGGIE